MRTCSFLNIANWESPLSRSKYILSEADYTYTKNFIPSPSYSIIRQSILISCRLTSHLSIVIFSSVKPNEIKINLPPTVVRQVIELPGALNYNTHRSRASSYVVTISSTETTANKQIFMVFVLTTSCVTWTQFKSVKVEEEIPKNHYKTSHRRWLLTFSTFTTLNERKLLFKLSFSI